MPVQRIWSAPEAVASQMVDFGVDVQPGDAAVKALEALARERHFTLRHLTPYCETSYSVQQIVGFWHGSGWPNGGFWGWMSRVGNQLSGHFSLARE